MKQILQHRSHRSGYDGWAIKIKGAGKPLDWTVCTTRAECRELRKDAMPELDLFNRTEVIKVKITVEAV